VAAGFFVLFTLPAAAQVAVYALGSGGRVAGPNVGAATAPGTSGSFTVHGETFGIYNMWAQLGPVSLGSDFRLSFQSSGNANAPNNNTFRDGFLGVRAAFKTPLPGLRPYVQAEFGGANTNYGRYSSESGSGAFAYQFQGGIDYALLKHLDLRGEYGAGEMVDSQSQLGSATLSIQQFGAGVVLRF
jgi:hypothetical protein